jgi:hypothetical protein
MMQRKRRKEVEQSLQRQCARFLAFLPAPPDGPYWTAINPVPAKSKAVAGISKAMGLRAGVPDFLFVFRGKVYFIELKRPKGTVSKDQKEHFENINLAGGYTAVIRDFDHFILQLKEWGMVNERVIV